MARLASLTLLLIGLATSAVAGPVNVHYNTNTECASFCPENTKFGFETGKTYEYGYESEVKTHIPGASTDHSSLHMNAKVKLEVLSRCEMALVLEDVVLEDVAPGSGRRSPVTSNAEFARALQRNPMRFAFVSGHVESLCPSEREETWVLNLKRGILSNFQNSMNDFYTDLRLRETDVTGECPVTYTTQGAGWKGVYTIKKSKNIEACQNRISADTIFQGTAYKTPSKMQSLPVLKGNHECEQKINKQGILTESSCAESHVFRPFAKGNSGATTDVKTKLTFQRESTGIVTPAGPIGIPISIMFDHEKSEEELTQSRRAAERILTDLCAQTAPGVTAQAPALFGKLITELKKLNAEALVSLHRDISTGSFCKNAEKYLHDAIPTIGTVASARLIKDLILSGEVSGSEEAMWLNSLAFVQHPSSAMLAEITPLLRTNPLHRQAALAISSLVNNFCRTNSDCSEVREVQAIVSAFGDHLVGGCRKATEEHDVVLMSLKAIGNTGHAESIADSINMCIRNTDLDVEIRVAAIQAFRRMACTADRTELTNVFENTHLDSELRINAYLSLMSCPTQDILRRVGNRLEDEEINQVGSFIWTHLTNLLETSSPLKQEIRQIVEKESLRKEFNVDKRKFSRNIEKSFFSDMMNSGASVESNLIWSSESFVPRSASVNLTADLFGHSINLVEIGGRVEGINGILDQIFDKDTPADENKDSTPEINEIDGKANVKRETAPKGSAYVRVFGNEISYVDFHDLDAETVREKFNYLNWLIELAKEHSVDYTKSFQFLDTTVTVATIAGFPLRMHVQGNAVTDIKMSGKFDVRNLVTAPRSLAIDGKFAPSAAVEISAEMGIDAYATHTGLRTVDTLHTSTVADGRITLRDGKIFDMDVNMPRDRMEVFSAKHDFFVVYRDQAVEMSMTGSRLEYNKCLSGTFSKVTGLEICGTVAVPDHLSVSGGPFAPLTAPGVVSVVINKKDTFTGFHFEAKALRESRDHEGHRDTVDVARVSFNTPGSKINREITMDFSLNHSEKEVSLSLITPWTPTAVFSGALTNTAELKRATGVASLGSTRYEALAEVSINTNKYNTRYEPRFVLTLPSGANPTISGSLLYRSGRKIDINMNAENVFSETVTAEGSITGQKKTNKIRYETALNIKSPMLNAKVDGFIDRSSEPEVYSSRLEVTYKPSGGVRNRLTFSGKIRDQSNAKKADVSGTMAFTSTLWARYNTDLKFEVQQQGRSLSTSFEGSLAGSAQKTIKFEQTGTLALGRYNKKANFEADVKFPYMHIDYNVKLDHEHKRDLLKSSAVLTKDGNQHGLFSIDMSRESISPLKASADIKLHYPGRQMGYRQTIEEIHTKHYTNDLIIQLDADEIVHLTGDYKMLPRHELSATLTSPFTSPINFVGHLNPVVRNFQVKAAVEHRGFSYAAEGSLNAKATTTRASISLIHPRRTITSDVEMQRSGKTYTGSFETKWNAVQDPSKKVHINGEIVLSKTRPALTIKAEAYPNRFFEVITSGNYVYGNGRRLEGNFLFKSSFEPLEEITASFKHKHTQNQISASGQLAFAPGRKIDTEFIINLRNGWSSVDANAKLTTPFPALKRVTYELDYAKESNTFRANTKGVYNRHNIGLALSGSATLPKMDGSITMTSSFKNLESITLSGSHVDTGLKCHTDAELTWGNNQKITIDYNGEHSRSGYYLNSNGDFTVTTPFKNFRSNKMTWRHSNDAGSVQHHTEVEIFRKKAAFDLIASIVSTGPTREFHIKSTLKAPETDMMISTNHQHSIRHVKGLTTDLTVQWDTGKSIVITQKVDLDNTQFVCLTKFTSPFEGFETITVDLDNRLSGETVTMKNEITWPGTKMSLDGNMVYRETELDGTFELSTPYFPKQRLTLMQKQQGRRMITKRSYEYAPGKKMEMNEEYAYGRTKSFSYEFKSPCPYLRELSFNIEHVGNERDFTTKADFFHNSMDSKIELVTKASTSDLSDMKLNINLKTPFRALRNMRAMYSHKLQDNDFTCTGSFQIPSYKATFDHEMTFVSWRRFNTKSTVMYRPEEKIELTTSLRAARKVAAVVTLKTPFEHFEDLSLKFNHEGPLTNMKSNAELVLDQNRKVSGSFEYQMVDGIHTFVSIDTPFRGYKNLGATFNLGPEEYKMDWSANIENERFAGQNFMAWSSERLNMRHSIETPFSGFENIILTFQHEGNWRNFKHEGLFEYPGSRFTTTSSGVFEGTRRIVFNSETHTPFRAFKSFLINVKHQGHLRDFDNNFAVILNGNKYEAESSVKVTRTDFTFNAKVNIPREFTITLAHNVDNTGGINKVFAVVNGQRISAESKFLTRGNNIEGSLLLLTPFEGYEKFFFDGKHAGPVNDFNCEYILELFGRRMTVTDEFKLRGNNLHAKIDIATPFRQLRTISAQVNHEGAFKDFKNEGIISINGNSYSAMSEYKAVGDSISGTASVNIPEEYRISFNHEGPITDFSNSIEIKAYNEVYRFQSELKLVGGRLETSASISTPTHQSRKVMLKHNLEGTPRNFVHEATLTYGNNVFFTKTEFEMERKDIKAKFELKTPFEVLESFIIDANHEAKSWKNFRNSIDVILNGMKRSASSDFKWFSNVFKVKLNANIPEDYSILLKNKGDLTDFATSLLISTPDTKVNSNCNFKLTDDEVSGSLDINTPFRHFTSQGITFDVKKTDDGFQSEAKILTDRPEIRSIEMALNHAGSIARFNTNGKLEVDGKALTFVVNHQGHISDFSSSATINVDGQTGTGQVTFRKTGHTIKASSSLDTPFSGYEHFGVTFDHSGDITNFQTTCKIESPFRNLDFSYNHKGRLNNFECNVNVESDGSQFTGVWKFRHSHGNVEFDGEITTPFTNYEKFGLVISHNSHARGLKTIIEVETPFRGYKSMNAELSHDGHRNDFHTAGMINIPSRPLKFDITHQGDRSEFNTNGFIEYAGRKYSVAKTFKYGDGDLDATGSFEMPRRRYAYSLNHKTGDRSFTTAGHIETPHTSYERASFNIDHRRGLNQCETSGTIKPFHGVGSFSINHNGPRNDFTTSANAAWNNQKVSASVTHHGNLREFVSSANGEWKNHRLSGHVEHRGNLNDFESSADAQWDNHKITGHVKHQGNLNGFESSANADWDEHKIAGNVNHRGHLNDFESSVNGQWNEHTITGNVNHHGNLYEFSSSAAAGWNNKRIHGNVDFKNQDGDIDSSATLETPFTGFERFHAIAKHNYEGKKMKTEARLETPFRSIRDPSIDIQHRGHWKNFKTMATIVTPFKRVMPVTINVNHRGILKDFTSTGNVEYGNKKFTGSASYKRTPTGMSASVDITTPFEDARKYGLDFEYMLDGTIFNTKSNLETPHGKFNFFGVEIHHEGDLSKFETSGKFEIPVMLQHPVTFEVNHEGRLTNFKTTGSIASAGRKIEGEASYKKSDGYFEADHDAFIRVATPFRHLRNADMTLSHAHNNGVWSGTLKGTYNAEHFDGDYRFANKAQKSASVTIREPHPMEYSLSVNPTTGRAEGAANWDTRTSDKNRRFEATWKNDVDSYKTDRHFTFTLHCPHHTRSLTTGYTINANKFATKSEFKWDSTFVHEMEISKNTRGRATIYDGVMKISAPAVNFEVNGNHNVNPSRRYLTEINVKTSSTLQVRSDIKTPKGDFSDFSATFMVSEPRLSKPVTITTEGKIDPDTVNYEGLIDLEYAEEKITFRGKVADLSTRYKTKFIAESSLKHPSNDLDMSYKGEFLSNRKTFSTESEFTYMVSRTRDMKRMSTKISLDKIREEAKIEVFTPVKSFEITGHRTIHEASRQHFSLSGSMDERRIQAEVDVDRTIPGIDVTLDYAPEKTLHMFGKYLSPDHFQINAYRQESGRKIPEVTFDTEIVAGNLIKARAFLRPSLVSEVSDLFSTESGLGRLYNEVTEAISEDLRLKAPGFKRAAAPVIDAMESVANDFARFAVRFERTFNRMYQRNEYYTRDISSFIARVFRAIRTSVDEAVEATTEAITSMESFYRDAAIKYDEWRRNAVAAYNRFYTTASAKMTHYRKVLQNKIDEHIDMAHANLLDLVNYIRTHPRVQALFDRIQAKAERIVERIDVLVDRLYDAGVQFLRRPEMEYVRKYINNANAKVAWVSEYINLEEKAHEFIHHLKETGFGPLRRTIWRTLRDYFHFDETKITIWAPERGEVAGQVYIPATMRDLRSMPTIKISGYFEDMKRFIPDTNWVFWDTLYAYKPSSDIRDWIPPFKSHATISGTQHYMTFDKKFFEFAGECSYLLARDMIDGTFSVVVNYKNNGNEAVKKSISVIHGKDKIDILPEFRVEVNGRRSEMPVVAQHTAVYRVGNTLRIDNDHGVKIACNLPYDHCTVSVTGWYFAKTGGLLGTYDNEPASDFRKPNGEITSSTEELASSWTVGKQCRAINRAHINEISPLNPNYQRCKAIFEEESSAFRPCFKQVDPEAFMKMCMNGDVCKVASFYVHECGENEVPIRMPRECVTCELPNGHRLSEGQEETLGSSDANKADVVFVVSHGECNQDAVEKIQMLVNQIQKGMKEAKIRNVQYGIVGYGGSGRESLPHSHTMDGQLLNSKTTFIETMQNFQTTSSDPEEDALTAIKFASTYPFRAGASKSIILIPCEKCSAAKTQYSTIQEVLSDNDIRFHMLLHHDFELRASTKSPKTSFMYGLDRESVYTNKDVGSSNILGDRDLRRHTVAPKDLCVALTHESDGSVFNILKLTQTKSIGQKRFADVFSRVVAKKGTPSECQVCECRSDDTGVGVSVCRSCDPPAPYVYSWEHIEGLPEPELSIPKKRRASKRAYN